MVFAFIPQAVLNRFRLTGSLAWHWNVVMSHLFLITAILATPCLSLADTLPHQCLSQSMLRVPCPGCGITSCLKATARGDFYQAWRRNPAGLGLLAGFVVQISLHSIAIYRQRVCFAVNRWSHRTGGLILSMLLIVWFYRLIQCFGCMISF